MTNFQKPFKLFRQFMTLGVGIVPLLGVQADLDIYIQKARENNPALKRAYTQWKSAEAGITAAIGLPNPSVSGGYFLESVETAAGPQEFKIGLTQKIPFPGKRRMQGEAQKAKANQSYYQYLDHQLKLGHEVRSVWYDYYFLLRSLALTKQNQQLIQNWDSVIRSRYVAARAGHPDLIKTQIELIQLVDELSTLENKKIPIIARFRSLLNDSNLDEIIVPEELVPDRITIDETVLKNRISQENPRVLGAQALVEMANAKLSFKKLNRLPDFGVGVESVITGEKEGSPVSGKDPLVAKLTFDLPIWFNKTNSEINSANLNLRSAESGEISVQNELLSDLEKVLFDLKESDRQIRLYEDILIPKGKESLGASEIAYRGDKIDFISLVDAQRRLLQFELKYEKAKVDYLKAKSKLSVLVGEAL